MKPKGWRNESIRHSLASRGIKTTQRIKLLNRLNQMKNPSRNVAIVRKLRENILKEMVDRYQIVFANPEVFQPFFDTISEKDRHYVAGDIFWKFGNLSIPSSPSLETYRHKIAPNIPKDRLKKIIYSDDPKVKKEVRELDEDIIQFLARNQGFKYRFVRDSGGEESLVTYNPRYKKENPKKYQKFIDDLKDRQW